MSEAEFDSYLSLLAKFLRLRSRQRGELADELRDHLDTRLEELLAQGKTREQAVQVALEEFGDAAVLATEFSRLASRRTRRFVMRCTAASAAVIAAVVLLSVSLAPPGPVGPGPEQAVAQGNPAGAVPGEGAAGDGVPAVPDKESVEQQAVAALDEKLGKVVPEVKFVDVATQDVLATIADQIDADFYFDHNSLRDGSVNSDGIVNLVLARSKLSARTVLGFVLEPQGLTFVNRSGVIYVTSKDRAEELLVTKVYNVRDLLEDATSYSAPGGGFGGMGGGGVFSVSDAAAAVLYTAGQMGGEGMGGGLGGAPQIPTGPAADLIRTIEETTSGPWAGTDGSGGMLTLFDGLLVVRQTEEVHGEVLKLLDAMRKAGGQQLGRAADAPNGEGPAGMAEAPSAPAAQVKVFALENSHAADVSELLTGLLSNGLGGGSLRVAADERTNAVIVTGTSADMQVIEALIQQLDRAGDVARPQPVGGEG